MDAVTRQQYASEAFPRILRLRLAMAEAAATLDPDLNDLVSALSTFLIEIFTEVLRRNVSNAPAEMKRIATLLNALADAAGDPDELRRVAVALCDAPKAPRAS